MESRSRSSWKHYAVGFLIRICFCWMFIFTKLAMNTGISVFVFIFYRQAAATLLLLPLAFFLVTREQWKRLSFKLLCKVFFNALYGVTGTMTLQFIGLDKTSPSVSSAVANMIPVITFTIALLLRKEALRPRSTSGAAKAAGILFCTAGAATIAFYHGPGVLRPPNHSRRASIASDFRNANLPGTLVTIASNILWSFNLISQDGLIKECSSKLLFTSLQSAFSAAQTFVIAVVVDRADTARWKLRLDAGLLGVVYNGLVMTGGVYYLQAWVIEEKGPVFLAMFTPITFVVAAVVTSSFFGETIRLGGVLGGALMVAGLYSVLWGKSKEHGRRREVDGEAQGGAGDQEKGGGAGGNSEQTCFDKPKH